MRDKGLPPQSAAASFPSAVHKLGRDIDTIERLSHDDRFPENLDHLAYSCSDLVRARDALQRIIDKLGGAE